MPQDAHTVVEALRTKRDEEMLDLVRETVAQLNKLGDRLEVYVREVESEVIISDESSQ